MFSYNREHLVRNAIIFVVAVTLLLIFLSTRADAAIISVPKVGAIMDKVKVASKAAANEISYKHLISDDVLKDYFSNIHINLNLK